MKSKFGIIIQELFQVSLATYLFLIVLETFRSGYVSNFFNPNYLLVVVLITGIFTVLPISHKKNLDQWDLIDMELESLLKQIKAKGITENNFYFILVLSIGGGIICFMEIRDIEIFALPLSIIASLLIFLLIFYFFIDPENID